MSENTSEIRELIDRHLSSVVPREHSIALDYKHARYRRWLRAGSHRLLYLATIGDFIKSRLADSGLSCQFIEKPTHVIQEILDNACNERLTKEGNIEANVSDDSILAALKDADESGHADEYEFDFDDHDEELIEEKPADLSIEMLGSKIQQSAAKILIHARVWSIWYSFGTKTRWL